MKKHQDFWEHLALVMVLLGIAISVLSYDTSVVGYAAKTSCSDSDGVSFTRQGVAQDSLGNTFVDSCSSSKMLQEGQCVENHVQILDYKCACFNGACLLENKVIGR